MDELVIAARFHGPAASGNGGYTCGLLAALVGEPVEVTLRLPPPLDRPLRIERLDGGVAAFDAHRVIAEARPVEAVELEVPAPPSLAEAEAASARYPGFERHAFPTCFVCGPLRAEGEGLRVFAGPLGDGRVAAPWTPGAWLAEGEGPVGREFAWAALDCPGAFAVGFSERGETVLGRMAAEVLRVPDVGEPCLVVAWPLGEEGRKLFAGTALFTARGELLGRARQTWIVPQAR